MTLSDPVIQSRLLLPHRVDSAEVKSFNPGSVRRLRLTITTGHDFFICLNFDSLDKTDFRAVGIDT